MAYKNCIVSDFIPYRSSVAPQLLSTREYSKLNIYSVSLSKRVDLGDGDYFFYALRCFENKITGNVALTHSVYSRNSGPVSPSQHCGKIDLTNIPLHILLRYESYIKKGSLTQYLKRRGKKLSALS